MFRGNLRNKGILVIESSAQDSILEGCSFYVGPSGAERPCVFANSYRTTWFRRNRILMHELAHAIFDVESDIATLDFEAGASTLLLSCPLAVPIRADKRRTAVGLAHTGDQLL